MVARRWGMLALCFVGIMVNYVDRSNFAVALPTMSKELGLTSFAQGMLLSAFFWLYVPALLPIGALMDRCGVRLVYPACMALWSVASGAIGLAAGFVTLMVLRLLMGAAEAGSFPSNAVVVARWFPRRQRGMASSIWHSGIGIGSAISFPIVVALIERYGWRGSFIATGVLGIACAVLWVLLYRDPAVPVEPAADVAPASRIPLGTLVTSRPALAMSGGYFLVNFANFFFFGWFPSYLAHERGVKLNQLAYVGPVPTVVAIVGGLLGGVVADALFRRGWSLSAARKTCLIGGLAVSCLIVPAAIASDLIASIALFSLSFAAISFASANIQALPPEMAPSADQVGSVSGFQMIGGAVAGIVSNIVIGALVGATGSYFAPVYLMGVLSVLAMLNYAFLLGPVRPIAFRPAGDAAALRA